MYAISLKQPWATLLVHGRKTIEVRKWPTARRGRVLIHAAKVSDDRPEVWELVPDELILEARQKGGIVGAGDIVQCITYRTLDVFTEDKERHLNDLSWFEPVLYGFVFSNLTPLPFQAYPGWMRFFEVELPETKE